jgi:hypothetical protein
MMDAELKKLVTSFGNLEVGRRELNKKETKKGYVKCRKNLQDIIKSCQILRTLCNNRRKSLGAKSEKV